MAGVDGSRGCLVVVKYAFGATVVLGGLSGFLRVVLGTAYATSLI